MGFAKLKIRSIDGETTEYIEVKESTFEELTKAAQYYESKKPGAAVVSFNYVENFVECE